MATSHPDTFYYPVSSQLAFPVQEKKHNIYFQDGGYGGHHGFPIGTILAIFDIQKKG